MNDTPSGKRPPRAADLFVWRTPDDQPIVLGSARGSMEVHVVLPNDPDSEMIELRSQGARARRWATLRDPESEEHQAHKAMIWGIDGVDALLDTLVANEMQKDLVQIPTMIRASKKWSEDLPLRALEDAWYGDDEAGSAQGLMYVWAMPEEERTEEQTELFPESERVMKLLMEFEAEVDEALKERRRELRDSYLQGDVDEEDDEALDDDISEEDQVGDRATSEEFLEELRVKALDVLLRLDADMAFLEEQRTQRIFYATRQVTNWRKRQFGTVEEVFDLPADQRQRIMDKFMEMAIDAQMGKESPGTPGSSTSFAGSDEAEASPPSGREVASV